MFLGVLDPRGVRDPRLVRPSVCELGLAETSEASFGTASGPFGPRKPAITRQGIHLQNGPFSRKLPGFDLPRAGISRKSPRFPCLNPYLTVCNLHSKACPAKAG